MEQCKALYVRGTGVTIADEFLCHLVVGDPMAENA